MTTGALNVYLSHDSLSSAGSESVDLSGSTTVSPDEVTIYTLTATNSAGSDVEDITITVNSDLPVYNLTKGTYYSTIQAAIDDSASEDIIEVSVGIYYENIVFNNRNITLQSTDPSNPSTVEATIIRATASDSVVKFSGGDTSTLQGSKITNGNASSGGGIFVNYSSPVITANMITDNTGHSGGGIAEGLFIFGRLHTCFI